VLLLTTSLHTNAGLVNLCAALCNGGACLATPGFDPAAYPGWLDEHGPTWTITNATELNLLLDDAAAAGRASVAGPRSRLRLVRAGAQPMTPGTVERAEASLRALVCDGFGMTEASYVTGAGPDAADRRPGSCGPPLNSEIRVLDERGVDLPRGATGEIVIRGETLFPGYLDDPAANTAVFLPGGWFRTGDSGWLDADGHLYVQGRLNELINRGGEKIAPVEVDRALLRHPAVAEAATFAVPDPRFGEDIVAAVVLRPGPEASLWELRGWLLDQLSPAKVPRRFWLVERLPRTPTGKVQRTVLAERYLNQS
jgi:acyl-CoA synthetase (AMP-forming)/AMP-acid ligase II